MSCPAQENLERGLHRFGTFLAVRQFGERVFRWAKELHKTRTGNISLATIFSDLKATYWMVGVALIGACIFSFVWILLMRYLAGEYFLRGVSNFLDKNFRGDGVHFHPDRLPGCRILAGLLLFQPLSRLAINWPWDEQKHLPGLLSVRNFHWTEILICDRMRQQDANIYSDTESRCLAYICLCSWTGLQK